MGAGVVGLAVAQALARAGPRGHRARGEDAHRHRHQQPQLGSHSCRNLLSDRFAQGAACASRADSCCIAIAEQYGVDHRPHRQVICRHFRTRAADPAKIPGAGACQWGRGSASTAATRSRQKLEPNVSCVAALCVAVHRHRRFARPHALAIRGAGSQAGYRACKVAVLRGRLAADGIRPAMVGGAGRDFAERHCGSELRRPRRGKRSRRSLRRIARGRSAAAGTYAKGHYFSLWGRPPFHHLVYPAAQLAGLGPMSRWISTASALRPRRAMDNRPSTTISTCRARRNSAAAIRLYYPELDQARLQPAYTGIRPKLADAAPGGRGFLYPRAGGACWPPSMWRCTVSNRLG